MNPPLPIPPEVTPARLAVALVAAFGTGTLVATQSRINGELAQRLGDGFLAAFISFASGLVILGIASLVWRPGRRGIARVVTALRERSIPWWLVLGGTGGALFVLAQGLTVGLLGVALPYVAGSSGKDAQPTTTNTAANGAVHSHALCIFFSSLSVLRRALR